MATRLGFARSLIERGVDLMCGQNAHVLQDVLIVDCVPNRYDAGDFVDDPV